MRMVSAAGCSAETVPWRDDLPDPRTPRPAWYAFGLMSRVLGGGPGYRTLAAVCEDDVYIAAVEQPGGKYAFLVVNAAHAPRAFEVQLSRPLNAALERWSYDPAAIEPRADGALPASDKRLAAASGWSDTLPARGVALYRTL